VNAAKANLGLKRNIRRAVAGAMELSDFAVILEDDVVVERDGLRWFEWHVTSGLIFERPDIALATCWSTSFPYHRGAVEAHDLLMVQKLGLLDKYWVDNWFQPWGWALWRRTWDAVADEWTPHDKKSWDMRLGQLMRANSWHETMPLVARGNNIGSVGVHKKGTTNRHVHRRAVTSRSFASLEQCRYTEMPRLNYTGPLLFEDLYSQLVRVGLTEDNKFIGDLLEEYAAAAEAFVQRHPAYSDLQSTC
jgi:hypothetical protein